jgi:hypothetical protein
MTSVFPLSEFETCASGKSFARLDAYEDKK